jgi:ABC-2 type transport system permease protein
MNRILTPVRRARQITSAFMWMGFTETVNYPLSLILNNVIGPASLPIIYRFVSRLVADGPEVANDYYTFVIIGVVTTAALAGGLSAFGSEVDSAIQQGRFETYLVQPINWYTLPFALGAWPIMLRVISAGTMGVIGVLLGAHIELAALLPAMLVLFLGVAASHAIGTLAASVRLLSKKADPVVTLYTMAAAVFSGAMFPTTMLPPWVRPIAYLLPHTYVISACRRILMPDGELLGGPSLSWSLTVLSVSTVALYGVCLFAFGRSLEFGRRYGILGGY